VIPRPEPERPVLICHRDPDYENNIIADKSLHVISVDLGASFDGLDSLEDEVAQEWVTERAAEVANLAVESKVKAAMCELLDRTGLPYVLAATGESTDANAIPVLVVRDPDCKNEYVSDDVIDVIDIDIAGEAVAAMSESQFEAFADELWHQVAHLDPEHRQRLALLVLLEEMRDLY
jgi:hypothetical protein